MSVTRQQIYIAVVGAIGTAVLIGSLIAQPAAPRLLLLFFPPSPPPPREAGAPPPPPAAKGPGATLRRPKPFSIELSITSAVSFAAALIFAPVNAGLVGAVGGATAAVISARRQKLNRQRGVEVLVFNAGMNALATLVGALVFQWAHGGPLTGNLILTDLPLLLLAAIVDDLVNAVALVVMITIQWAQKPFTIWRENFAWAAPINVATMAVGGGALALGYEALGLTGLLVFFLPVFLSVYAFRAYIPRPQGMGAPRGGMG